MATAHSAEPSHDQQQRQVGYADLAGRVAVVTGGSRGIGAGTAAALAANGAAVAAIGRDRAALDAVIASITDRGGRALGVVADCTSESDLAAARRRVRDELGPADIIAAFAGGGGAPVASAAESADHWQQVITTNLTSTFLTISAFLPDLTASAAGTIITMASSAARQATRASAAYAAAKGGITALTRHLASELAGDGVRVNCLAPATVENDTMRARMPVEHRERLAASFPLGRLGQPVDVAAATLFLASQASSWITGITLDIAGGAVMP